MNNNTNKVVDHDEWVDSDFVEVRKGSEGEKSARLVNPQIEAALAANPELRLLRHYLRGMYRLQKQRIQTSNTIGELERIGHTTDELSHFVSLLKSLRASEASLERRCGKILKGFPVHTAYLGLLNGVGVRTSASLIAAIVTPSRFRTVSSLISYAGLNPDPVTGKARVRKKGQKASWHQELRATGFRWSANILKSRKTGRWAELYYQFKEREVALNDKREEPLTKMVVDLRTRRRLVKLFLSHLWEVWRRLEGLPVRKPYAIEYLGHSTIIEPFIDEGEWLIPDPIYTESLGPKQPV